MRRAYEGDLKVAIVEVTNRCNLRCPHCASASGCARQDEMTLVEMRRLMRDLAALGCLDVTLLGGELLLRPDWAEIAEAVRAEGMSLRLITNGLLVTPAVRARLTALSPAAVGVSLDGATRETYLAARGVDGYERCRRLLDDLVEDGIGQVSAITTFTSRNFGDFDAFVQDFTGKPFTWQVQLVHKAGERFDDSLLLSREQYAWFVDRVADSISRLNGTLRLQTMDDFGYFPMSPTLAFLCQTWDGCPAGRHVIGIRANGDLLPCLSLGGEFVEGNVRRRPIVDAWRDAATFARFRGKTAASLRGKCAKCPKAAKCRAGCSASAISTTGDMGENAFCIRALEAERMIEAMLDG